MLRRAGSHVRNQWMGALSLFLVLAGGTAAAATVALDGPATGQNSVGSLDIIDRQVQNVDIQDSAVRGGKVRDESLTGADIDEATLNASAIPGGDRIGRFELHGSTNEIQVIPGLRVYSIGGGAPTSDMMAVRFITGGPGIVNYMAVASGIDGTAGSGGFNLVNGAQDRGGLLNDFGGRGNYEATIQLSNDHDANASFLTSAHAETQMLIDSGGVTYDISLHVYIREDGYSEATGTAIRAE